MISRTDAERIAAAISILRPDWLTSSIVTLITRDLAAWSLLDVTVGLAYVAADRKPDGTWASKTPARVKEQGPWRLVGVADPEAEAVRRRYEAALEASHATIAARAAAVRRCGQCDSRGYLPNGVRCLHIPLDRHATHVHELAEVARAQIKPSQQPARDAPYLPPDLAAETQARLELDEHRPPEQEQPA
jgi:hypothetical protein